MTELKMADVSARIDAHLKRIQRDKSANRSGDGRTILYCSGSWPSGNRVFITYKSYQNHSSLTKEQALRYLSKLDAGFVGRHFEAFREPE